MKQILVIDDDAQFRKMLTKTLIRAGYSVLEAADGKIGMDMCRRQPPELVITDIIMPEQEGLETIRHLRRNFPALKIIAISGGGDRLHSFDALGIAEKLGAHHSFHKPVDRGAMLEAVGKLLQ